MTSPVDTSVKLFSSAMLAAPPLSGTAGALISLLDACLVTGFDLKPANSLVVASGVATLSFTGTHSAAVDSVILVENASVGALNGEQRVISVAAGVVRFATAAANGTATGAVTFKMAPAGWAKAFNGVNLAAYKSLSAEATGCLLRVDDSAAQVGRVRGFESMADINTGVNGFPTAVQIADAGMFLSKSNAADSTARAWMVIADDRAIYYFVRHHSQADAQYQGSFFGDILSFKSNDPYACVLRANDVSRANQVLAFGDELGAGDNNFIHGGCFIARAPNALGGAVACQHTTSLSQFGTSLGYMCGSVGMPYPSPVDNGLLLAPMTLYNATGYRGTFPGLWPSPQRVNGFFTTGQVVAGSGAMAGKKVLAVQMRGSTEPGTIFVDHIGPWRA